MAYKPRILAVADGGTGLSNFYETGTFTPTITGNGTTGTTTYNSQNGYYTRFGNVVWVFGFVDVASTSGAAGAVRVGNLPFTIKSQTGGQLCGSCNVNGASYDWGSGFTQCYGWVNATGVNYFILNRTGSVHVTSNLTITTSAATFNFSIMHQV